MEMTRPRSNTYSIEIVVKANGYMVTETGKASHSSEVPNTYYIFESFDNMVEYLKETIGPKLPIGAVKVSQQI